MWVRAVAKDEEKAEVIKTSCSQDIQPPELGDRDQEEKIAPIIHNNPFSHKGKWSAACYTLRYTKVCGAGWDPPECTEGAGRRTQ